MAPASTARSTTDRIIDAFLVLAAERGIEGATTRDIAEAAQVNEVTLFRQFGDKATLARESLRRRMPVAPRAEPIDTSTPAAALAGVVQRVLVLRDLLVDHAELIELGISATRRHPGIAAEIRDLPLSGLKLIESALREARSHLRDDVDLEASSLTLLGLVVVTMLWQRRNFIRLTKPRWNALIENAVRPLFREARR